MLNLNTIFYRSEITKHSAKCFKQLKRVAPTVPVPVQKHISMHYLDWIMFLVTFLVFELIFEHCKFEQIWTKHFVTVHTWIVCFVSYLRSRKPWLCVQRVQFIMRHMIIKELKMKLMTWFYWKFSDFNPQPLTFKHTTL